jgi:endoglucanase
MNSISTRRIFSLFCFVAILVFATYARSQELTKYIVVDQFGYLPDSKKIAVIRDPQTGYDAGESFSPGSSYALVDKNSGLNVTTSAPMTWNAGATDPSSGDKAWWFDFSSVTAPGTYYVLDIDNNKRSYEFTIAEDVYHEVLKHAVRTFFYQRAGFEKAATYAGAEWADGASHLKSQQDKNARQYNKTNDASTERDLSGGWYDAGDYNKYTAWTAAYIVDFMRAYLEAPAAWGDDYNIPESGNHVPDLLDEAKWGLDHLLRMQNPDGAMLTIVGMSHASPPSSATGPSYYGTPSTSATLHSAAAFALASSVFASRGMAAYAATLKASAIKAWNWAVANPKVLFSNNDSAHGTSGLGAGQQETDDYGRQTAKLKAACFLFGLTGEAQYRDYFDANYSNVHIFQWTYASVFETSIHEVLLHYTTLPGATASVVNAILSMYKNTMNNGEDSFQAFYNNKDPYSAHIQVYTWGSNSVKSLGGLMYSDMIYFAVDASKTEDARTASEGYIHYLHGVNPFNLVYLSNMYANGAENSVNEFYHSWFTNGSAKWDRVGTSTYGPAPGFLTGGPNPSYKWDSCCPAGCGGSSAICTSESLTPPNNQPAQKSYKDFNTSWPLNSWSLTENSNGYQINYIRLLSKFVKADRDCSGTTGGTASFDICNKCSGGNTGVAPVTDESLCNVVTGIASEESQPILISPNPTTGTLNLYNPRPGEYEVSVVSSVGSLIRSEIHSGNSTLSISDLPSAMYIVITRQKNIQRVHKIFKQ